MLLLVQQSLCCCIQEHLGRCYVVVRMKPVSEILMGLQ